MPPEEPDELKEETSLKRTALFYLLPIAYIGFNFETILRVFINGWQFRYVDILWKNFLDTCVIGLLCYGWGYLESLQNALSRTKDRLAEEKKKVEQLEQELAELKEKNA
ncbi:MAG: hypothetical protein IPG59_00920 [Candidatus Melainabacteria bacterium]|nr:MAG: hypothetical protein IPG59_00920 [Candidatus Melainabacteria bacterium]